MTRLEFESAVIELRELAWVSEIPDTPYHSWLGVKVNALADKIIRYDKERNMRILYLHSPDPVRNFWDGVTKCPHTKPPVSGLAKDCLACLRNLVAKDSADIHNELHTKFIPPDRSPMDIFGLSGKFAQALHYLHNAFLGRKRTPPGSPVACVASDLRDGKVYWALSTRHQKLDKWDWNIAIAVAMGRLGYEWAGEDEGWRLVADGISDGVVEITAKPVVVAIMKQIIDNHSHVPKHVRKAAENYLIRNQALFAQKKTDVTQA